MWIGQHYKKHVFNCPDGTRWIIGKKLSEKEIESDGWLYESGDDTSEAQAVYRCRQIHGPSMGQRAILKVRMQIPEDEYPSSNPKVRARDASDVYGVGTVRELNALDWLTKRGCSVSPSLLYIAESTQDEDDMPVPGGWIVFILMERLPGVPLNDFRTYDFAKREKIRRAFSRSMTNYAPIMSPFSTKTSRTSFMMKTKINGELPSYVDVYGVPISADHAAPLSYFVDFEDVWIDPKKRAPTFTEDLEYEMWWLDDKRLGLVDSPEPAVQAEAAEEAGEIEKGVTMLTF